MTDRPRLIEVAFPLRQASVASVHEKNVRHGHISTLHVWPARRPLAASRAALLATLLPDPGDPEKRQALLDAIGGQLVTEQRESVDNKGQRVVEDRVVVKGGVLAWGQENAEIMDSFREQIRKFNGGKAPRVLDPFAGGGAIPLEAMRLGCKVIASDLNPVAWFILKCTLEYPQKFAGKTWPLPSFVTEWPDFIEDFLGGKIKKRKGGRAAHFTDDRQLLLMDLPEANLSWQVRAWGRWVLERARQDLASRYPVIDGEAPIAYLWARNAQDKSEPFARIPLLKTFWLSKSRGRRCALIPIPSSDRKSVECRLLEEAFFQQERHEWSRLLRDYFPHLESWGVTGDNLEEFLDRGTMNGAGVWSPCSGRPTTIALTMEDLRVQGRSGLLSSQMTAVVVEHTDILVKEGKKGRRKEIRKTSKRYRIPDEIDLQAASIQEEDLETVFTDIPFGIPDEPSPAGGGSGASRAFSLHKYGMKKWRDLFTSRQLYALAVLIKHSRAAIEGLKITSPELAEPVAAGLGLSLDRLIDFANVNVQWKVDAECINHSLVRYALQITWDFGEPCIIGEYSGAYGVCCARVCEALEEIHANATTEAEIFMRSACENIVQDLDVYITDPPYYDAIPYSDLSDLFLIWLKRLTFGLTPSYTKVMDRETSPKWDSVACDGELVDDESRFGGDRAKSKANYEEGMAAAFKRACEALALNGRIVIVFANKEVDAWETLIGALIKGGAIVTASWPIQTEQPSRMRGLGSAALSSSVWIVCRKRPADAAPGWDEQVLESMQAKLFEPRTELGDKNILQYYFDQGIIGPDFLWAALGPALEAYSAHPFVRKADGSGVMTVGDFLGEVRKLVLQFALGRLLHAEGLDLDAVTQSYLLHRSTFGVEPAPAGACILYAMSCGKNLGELQMVWRVLAKGGKKRGKGRRKADESSDDIGEVESTDTKGNELVLVDWQVRGRNEDIGEPRGDQASPLIDRVQRLLVLLHQGRASDVQQLFNKWALASEPAFKPLLQALRELALRDKQDMERRMIEALATTLKMNNRHVTTPDGELQQSPLFDDADVVPDE